MNFIRHKCKSLKLYPNIFISFYLFSCVINEERSSKWGSGFNPKMPTPPSKESVGKSVWRNCPSSLGNVVFLKLLISGDPLKF